MKLIISKSVQYDIASPDSKFCNECSFVRPKKCGLFRKGLQKDKHERYYRRCEACLFAEVKPHVKES